MDNLTKKPSKKVIVAVIVVFVILAVFIFCLGNYYSKNNGNVAGETEMSPDIKLLSQYKKEFKESFQGYLLLTSDDQMLSDDFLSKTIAVRKSLLEMKVPSDLRGNHLNVVFYLTDIENGIKSSDISAVIDGVYQLRSILDNL
jgi:hypothetical protein